MPKISEILNNDVSWDETSSIPPNLTPSLRNLGESIIPSCSENGILTMEPKEVNKGPADQVKQKVDKNVAIETRSEFVGGDSKIIIGDDVLEDVNLIIKNEVAICKDDAIARMHASYNLTKNGNQIALPTFLPKSKIRKDLIQKKLVQIAIRRKSLTKTVHRPNSGTKLHIKSLEAGLRVKLTLAPNLLSLYNCLTPHTNRQPNLYVMNTSNTGAVGVINNDNYLNDILLVTKSVQLIDNNLVNLSTFSNKMLKTFNHTSPATNFVSTFNSLNTAVHTLFNINEYSLVRITRSATNDQEGSTLLKLETAKSGELNLIDDDDFVDEMLHSIGKINDPILNLFIKKVVARPRYKSDMKIYLIPKNLNCSIYVDKRMLERDLIHGVVDLPPFYKDIYCAFEQQEILDNFKMLMKLSLSLP